MCPDKKYPKRGIFLIGPMEPGNLSGKIIFTKKYQQNGSFLLFYNSLLELVLDLYI